MNHLEPPQTLESRKALQTRVSELEVINELFKGRVHELESSLEEYRRQEEQAKDAERRALTREAELKRRVEELEADLVEYREGPRAKKMRLSDLVVEDGSPGSTPLSSAS